MREFMEKDWRVFDLFARQWALATAGTPGHFNTCTISWGSMGVLWGRPVLTVYLHPSRYTQRFFAESDAFTVSFFPKEQRPALALLGERSGRDGDKVTASGLTPVAVGDSVGFEQAHLTFLCKKLSQQPFDRDSLAPQIRQLYQADPGTYPVDERGAWQPHWAFVGEILSVDDRREG